jgi:hypothetical protein
MLPPALPHALMHPTVPDMPPACTQVGATNSQLGTVEQVVLGQPEEGFELPEGEPYVSHLIVRLQTGRRVKVSRTISKAAHPHGVEVTRSTWPCQLAYALTAHRAQASGSGAMPSSAVDAVVLLLLGWAGLRQCEKQ